MSKAIYNCDDVKRLVTCRAYLESQGIRLDAASRCVATWRGGTHPNVHVSAKDGMELWHDFKTTHGGTVIDLCMEVEGFTDAQMAANALGERFNVPQKHKKQKPAVRTRGQMLTEAGFSHVTTYEYADADGNPMYYVDRYEWRNPFSPVPDGFKRKEFVQRTPEHEGLDADTPQLLYKLPQVAAETGTVYIAEGEKDVETLCAWGLTATSNSGGASKGGSKKWPTAMNKYLVGKDVVVLADNDENGQAHADNLREVLAPVAKSIRVLTVSKLPKGDVTDWAEQEGGTKDRLLELVSASLPVATRAVEDDATATALANAKLANETPFANYVVAFREGSSGRSRRVDEPRPINDLVADVHTRLLGFPKRLGDYTLFDHDRDTGRIEILDGKDALFAWIGQKSKRCVVWKKIDGAVSKGELYSGLLRAAPRYEKTSDIPDFPMRKDVYYTFGNIPRPTPGHGAFKKLLSFFDPEDDASAALLAAFFAAPMYFKYGFQRPCWIIDSHEARGVGKTTLVNRVAELYGCKPICTNRNELERNAQELLKRIVSVTGRASRILLLDNLKGKFDDPQFADLVTAPSISGRAPYGHGEEFRPNDLTFVITSNSAVIGSDIASRAFMVFLSRPPKKQNWTSDVIRHITDNRIEILGDIYDICNTVRAPAGLRTYTRVPDFEREVVYPMCGDERRFSAAMESMLAARDSANSDAEIARDAVDTIRDELRKTVTGFDPDTGIVFLRTNVVTFWLKSLKLDAQDVWNMVNTKQIKCFHRTIKAFPRYGSHPLRGRGFMYIGPNVIPPETAEVKILRMSGEKSVVIAGSEQSQRLMRDLADEGWFARATSVVDADAECSDEQADAPQQQISNEIPTEALPL